MKRKPETTAPFEPEPTEEEKKTALFLARLATEPSVNAALVIAAFGHPLGDLQLNALVRRLTDGAKFVAANDLSKCEAMLYAQAHALQVIFMSLGQSAARDMGQRLDLTERRMRIALKAQNQCRMTLETLAALKRPPLVVTQQTNIANGPQQVNNGPPTPCDVQDGRARTGETQPAQNELLGIQDGERLDGGTTCAASGADPAMAAMGPFDWSKND